MLCETVLHFRPFGKLTRNGCFTGQKNSQTSLSWHVSCWRMVETRSFLQLWRRRSGLSATSLEQATNHIHSHKSHRRPSRCSKTSSRYNQLFLSFCHGLKGNRLSGSLLLRHTLRSILMERYLRTREKLEWVWFSMTLKGR